MELLRQILGVLWLIVLPSAWLGAAIYILVDSNRVMKGIGPYELAKLAPNGGRSPTSRFMLALFLPYVGIPRHLLTREKFRRAQSEIAETERQLANSKHAARTSVQDVPAANSSTSNQGYQDYPIEQFRVRKAVYWKADSNVVRYADLIFADSGLVIAPLSEFSLPPDDIAELVVQAVTQPRARASQVYDELATNKDFADLSILISLSGRVPRMPIPVEILAASRLKSFLFEDGKCRTYYDGIVHNFASGTSHSIADYREPIEKWFGDKRTATARQTQAREDGALVANSSIESPKPPRGPINQSGVAAIAMSLIVSLLFTEGYLSSYHPETSFTVAYWVVLLLSAATAFYGFLNIRLRNFQCPFCSSPDVRAAHDQPKTKPFMTNVLECKKCESIWITVVTRWWSMLWLLVGLFLVGAGIAVLTDSISEGTWAHVVAGNWTRAQTEAFSQICFCVGAGLGTLGYAIRSLLRRQQILHMHEPGKHQAVETE